MSVSTLVWCHSTEAHTQREICRKNIFVFDNLLNIFTPKKKKLIDVVLFVVTSQSSCGEINDFKRFWGFRYWVVCRWIYLNFGVSLGFKIFSISKFFHNANQPNKNSSQQLLQSTEEKAPRSRSNELKTFSISCSRVNGMLGIKHWQLLFVYFWTRNEPTEGQKSCKLYHKCLCTQLVALSLMIHSNDYREKIIYQYVFWHQPNLSSWRRFGVWSDSCCEGEFGDKMELTSEQLLAMMQDQRRMQRRDFQITPNCWPKIIWSWDGTIQNIHNHLWFCLKMPNSPCVYAQ